MMLWFVLHRCALTLQYLRERRGGVKLSCACEGPPYGSEATPMGVRNAMTWPRYGMKRYKKWCSSSSKMSADFLNCSQTRGFYGEPPTGAEVCSESNFFPTRATHRIQFHQRDEQVKFTLFS